MVNCRVSQETKIERANSGGIIDETWKNVQHMCTKWFLWIQTSFSIPGRSTQLLLFMHLLEGWNSNLFCLVTKNQRMNATRIGHVHDRVRQTGHLEKCGVMKHLLSQSASDQINRSQNIFASGFAGCTEHWPNHELTESATTSQKLKQPNPQLRTCESETTSHELSESGTTNHELRVTNYPSHELRFTNYPSHELRVRNYPSHERPESGTTIDKLRYCILLIWKIYS